MQTDIDKLKLVLQFLALSREQKETLTPKNEAGIFWQIYETRIQTNSPLLCMAYESWACLDHLYEWMDTEQQSLLVEIRVLLNLMIELREDYDHIWTILEANRAIEGDEDRLWDILQSLAKMLLGKLRWSQDPPEIDFSSFFTVGQAIQL